MRTLYNYIAMGLDKASLFIGKAKTVHKGRMICHGLIPFVSFKNGDKTEISGELFELNEEMLNYLDTLEFPYGYVREHIVVHVFLEDGTVKEHADVVVYAYNNFDQRFMKGCYEEESGDFWRYIETRLTDEEKKMMIPE